jgi:hypothetical protein
MHNWCICRFFTHIFTGILIFKGLTARRLYKSFDIKGLSVVDNASASVPGVIVANLRLELWNKRVCFSTSVSLPVCLEQLIMICLRAVHISP